MLFFPNAKINIGLSVTEKRSDGFHNLETVFYPVLISDILEFTFSENKTSFNNTGLKINIPDKENLVLKAYNLLKNEFKLPELSIHLHKIIPFGAGLGGGSSDAAFMLKVLNEYFNLKLPEKSLIKLAGMLGSDCPFFIKNNPVFAEGTGNIFTEIDLDLSEYYILIVKPEIAVGTKEAFKNIVPRKPEISVKDIVKLPVEEWKSGLTNDFEKTVFKLYPEIKKIKDKLYETGAVYAQMSGSGSAVFGIFTKKPEITESFSDYFVFLQKPSK